MSRITSISSSYYPRRSKWYSRYLYLWLGVKGRLQLEALHLPRGLSGRDFLLGLLWPGHAFGALGRKFHGRWLKCLYALAALVFVMALGTLLANLAFALMISIHVISILFLLSAWINGLRWLGRAGLALAILAVLGPLVYQPLLRQMAKHVAMPLKIDRKIVIMNPRAAASHVRVGDTIVYSIAEQRMDNLQLAAGFGIEKVLAGSGDHVRFGPEGMEVNGKLLPREAHMPMAGDLIVPKKCWLIWPRLAVSAGHDQGNQFSNISIAMWQAAMVSENQFAGRPYQHWFGRKQTLP